MKEKERYVYHEVSNEVEQYVCYYDIEECQELFDDEEVLNRLNQQNKEIKYLQKLNTEIIMQNKNILKDAEIINQENQQLKQIQKQLAIDELEKLKFAVLDFSNGYWRYFKKNGEEFMKSTDLENCLKEFCANQIEKLKGE